MSPEKSNRGEKLLGYVQENIRRLEAGEITRLPTSKELAHQFGYRNSSSPHGFLKRRGLWLGKYESFLKPPDPSMDLSWFLGILSAGGSVSLGNTSSRIALLSDHENLLEKFKLIGEKLFSLDVHRLQNDTREKSWGKLGYAFYGKKLASFLGDLSRDSWAKTILTVHPWVIDNQTYRWGFINGFFEKRGRVFIYRRPNDSHNLLTLSTPSQSGANLLLDMLVRCGLKYPGTRSNIDQNGFRSVEAVAISNMRDIWLFAQNVHSAVPEKESDLEQYRIIDLGESVTGRIYSTNEVIDEWKIIRQELQRMPKYNDVNYLRKEGKVTISPGVYAKRFGGGSFVKAREELERIIREN